MNKVLNLRNLVAKYSMNIKGVIHIGAHFGEENRLYDVLDIKNRIFFEPLSSNFSVLNERLKGKFPTVKKALGNENKKVTMFVEKENKGQSSSILKPVLHLVQYPHIKFGETEIVDMVRLDDSGIDFAKYNFISIDVQGYELEAFKGAEKTLKHIDYIVSEINRDELYEDCARVEQLVEFLALHGFELVEEAWVGGSWGDGLFIRKS
ncbi:MAG TPA: FkbM family methyltransferase [Candidatus Saccharimonadales bacterium]|nr:FkbM family methyltransferase [Candidatus Saccharimonadales bacterium]